MLLMKFYTSPKLCFRKKFIIKALYLVFIIIFAIFLPFLRKLDKSIISRLMMAVVWSAVGPFLIVKYYQKFDIIIKMLTENEHIFENSKVRNSYNKHRKINTGVSIFWVIILILVLLRFPRSLEFLYIFGYKDPLYWLFLGFALILLYFTSTGFYGVMSCIWLVSILNQEAESSDNSYLQILISQDKEVFKELTKFCLMTSIFFSAGIFFIPILLAYIHYSSSLLVHAIIVVAIILYSIFIFLSYIIPMWIINNNIREYKNKKLDIMQDKYYKAVFGHNHIQVLSFYFQMQYIREEIIIPEALGRILKVLIVSVIPILVFLLDHISFIQTIFKILTVF